MRLGIFCNFGPFEHCGGSETVIENIAKRLVADYGYEVNVYAHNYKKISVYHGVKTIPCKKGDGLLSQIAQNDHIFTYSDSFWGWDTIVENIKKIKQAVSVSLVGAYHMRSRGKRTRELFRQNIDRFKIICHSRGEDYRWAVQNKWKVHIIPNGVNLDEFNNNDIDFREKYKIKEKYVILNISNFFYGKGQELLYPVACEVRKEYLDFRVVSISNSVDYPYDKSFLAKTKNSFIDNIPRTFLRDIPREDVVAAFKCSDVFIFPSKKEVAPLVILESIAANLPWIAFDVGNIKEQKGGIVVPKRYTFNNGYIIPDEVDINKFATGICRIIGEPNMFDRDAWKHRLKKEMKRDLDMSDWKNIVPEYDRVFNL